MEGPHPSRRAAGCGKRLAAGFGWRSAGDGVDRDFRPVELIGSRTSRVSIGALAGISPVDMRRVRRAGLSGRTTSRYTGCFTVGAEDAVLAIFCECELGVFGVKGLEMCGRK